MLYAPWCSRSKRLAAEWTALAKRYQPTLTLSLTLPLPLPLPLSLTLTPTRYQRDKGLVVAQLDARRRVHKRVRV